jgi:hypothetical protein
MDSPTIIRIKIFGKVLTDKKSVKPMKRRTKNPPIVIAGINEKSII